MSDTVRVGFNAVSREYDENRRKLIPCFDNFYGTIVEQLPQGCSGLRVLDVGAGTGLLSAMILKKCPDAEITLIDIAEKMVDQARERFCGNEKIRYVIADYSDYEFDETYDVIVSSLSIHHLTDEAKRKLYRSLYNQLSTGGIFINGDQFLGRSEECERRNMSWWRHTIEQAGIDLVQLDAWEKRTAMDIPATVDRNIQWLEEAGFVNADLLFKSYLFGVISGEKK